MALQIEGLSFAYPDKPVLQNVCSGRIPAAQLTALLGSNAAGKSTLFRCLAGLQLPEQGQITLADRRLDQLSRAERIEQVCYMPQNYASQAALTVFEVVLLACKQLQDWRVKDADIDRVAALLSRFRIDHLAQRYIGELSGGQQQIVALCQAMVRPAGLFLLDEPTSALDLRHQLEVMTTLREMTRERQAVTIAAMHDLNLAARFADHIILMKQGQVIAAGATEAILASPELAQTYGVNIELKRAADGVMMVGASL